MWHSTYIASSYYGGCEKERLGEKNGVASNWRVATGLRLLWKDSSTNLGAGGHGG
jgi:hypothetical protein